MEYIKIFFFIYIFKLFLNCVKWYILDQQHQLIMVDSISIFPTVLLMYSSWRIVEYSSPSIANWRLDQKDIKVEEETCSSLYLRMLNKLVQVDLSAEFWDATRSESCLSNDLCGSIPLAKNSLISETNKVKMKNIVRIVECNNFSIKGD